MLRRRSSIKPTIDPDEVFLDASNLPSFNTQQFEGRIDKPISKRSIWGAGLFCLIIILIFTTRVTALQIFQGDYYAKRSLNNSLRLTPIFPKRGIIYDRTGKELAWNKINEFGSSTRVYIEDGGFAHILGYVSYPKEEEMKAGDYHEKEYIGRVGTESRFNDILHGKRGTKVEEVNVGGKIISDYVQQPPTNGRDLALSIDAKVQGKLFEEVKGLVDRQGFIGGSGVIMDVNTGQILALTSYPEYSPNVMSVTRESSIINGYFKDKRKPFLDRAVSGLYTPGSIVKPFVSLGALKEGIISPDKQIESTGQISIQSPYDPKIKSVFKDWKAHGWVDMRHAISVSSDVYFYAVGGGYAGQKGLGITKLDQYFNLFGLTGPTGIELDGEATGTIPTPEWKAKVFNGEDWRIGDTYHTAIGQYGMQVTPLSVVRAIASIATNGQMVQPTILASSTPVHTATIDIPPSMFQIVREGMRLSAQEGTAKGLNIEQITVGAKTGTAELGAAKDRVNSWVVGFFPYEKPRYAFAVVMESGPRANTIGGVYIMRQVLDWLTVYGTEYLK
ncbi:MAG: penicillin-binding transpeptidase domain-containing protein [bacterium]